METWRKEHCVFSDANIRRIEGISHRLGQQDIKLAQISAQNSSMQGNIIDMRKDIRALVVAKAERHRWGDKSCEEEDKEEEDKDAVQH